MTPVLGMTGNGQPCRRADRAHRSPCSAWRPWRPDRPRQARIARASPHPLPAEPALARTPTTCSHYSALCRPTRLQISQSLHSSAGGKQQQLSSLRRQLIFQRRESALRQPQLARLEEVNDAEALHRVERVKAQRTARGQVPVVREDTLQPASRLFDAHERLEQPTRHELPIGIAIVGEVADFRQELFICATHQVVAAAVCAPAIGGPSPLVETNRLNAVAHAAKSPGRSLMMRLRSARSCSRGSGDRIPGSGMLRSLSQREGWPGPARSSSVIRRGERCSWLSLVSSCHQKVDASTGVALSSASPTG